MDRWKQSAGSSEREDQLEESSRAWREKRSGSTSRDLTGVNLKMLKIQPSSSRPLSSSQLEEDSNLSIEHFDNVLSSVDENKKLKMDSKEHTQLKLKYNVLEEQNNTLLKQNKSLLDQLKSKGQVTVTEHEKLKEKHNTFVEQLKGKVECPVCYEVPKRTPIPVCPNGHIVCQKCRQESCPMCREPMKEARSLVAATVVENLLHNCDYIVYGCKIIQANHSDILNHLDICPYRPYPNAWKKLSEVAGIKLRGKFVDLGLKFSPVTSFYDFEEMDRVRKKVMWPPNPIQFDGTIFFLNVIADVDCGIWRFIVEGGDGNSTWRDELRTKYMASIEVFKPGDNSGCRRHFHMHRSTGRFDNNQQHFLTLDDTQMQGLFLEKKFAVSVEIGFVRDLIGKMGFCCDMVVM